MADGPPPRLTPDQRAVAARLRAAGLGAWAADVLAGRVDPDDLTRWKAEYDAACAAARCRGGWVTSTAPGGDILGAAPMPAGALWVGAAGSKGRRVMRAGTPGEKDRAELWTVPGAAGWWRVV
jgi:hypothetical protein